MPDNKFYNRFDAERMAPRRDAGEHRTPFQRDRDGIIYSSAFRRLQAKTQVFLSGEQDCYRTRLTHSIEVAQIGRGICNLLQKTSRLLSADFLIDPELVEGICLAHDLGHPPFGHAGERTLHELMREKFGGFEGNAQSLRILTETIYSAGNRRRGLNPTRAFLDGVLKYKSLFSELESPPNHFLYDIQKEFRDFVFPRFDIATQVQPGRSLNEFRSIECQVMDWADDTAYSINDIVDSVNAGFLDVAAIRAWEDTTKPNRNGKRNLSELCTAIRLDRIEPWAGRKIGEFIHACSLSRRDTPMSRFTNRYRFQLHIDPAFLEESSVYKRLAVDRVFRGPVITRLEKRGDRLLKKLFNAYASCYLKNSGTGTNLPEGFHERALHAQTPAKTARVICDYIAGMTDGFATKLYHSL